MARIAVGARTEDSGVADSIADILERVLGQGANVTVISAGDDLPALEEGDLLVLPSERVASEDGATEVVASTDGPIIIMAADEIAPNIQAILAGAEVEYFNTSKRPVADMAEHIRSTFIALQERFSEELDGDVG